MRRPSHGSPCTAFTLVEVLIVILLIATLMAILLPALSQVRAAGQRVKCASQLRQIGMAVVSYDTLFHMMPAANRNVVLQLTPILGQVEMATGAVGEVYRCPSDAFLQEAHANVSISYAPTEDDTSDGAIKHCPWSLVDQGRTIMRPRESVSPDTVIMVEYWHPANRANAFSYTPGWVRGGLGGTLAWDGGPCKQPIPPDSGSQVGGYLFLRAFDAEAEGIGKPHYLTRIIHRGYMNASRADGSAGNLNLRNVTKTSPADYPIWTRDTD